jgi:hypothetical protein
MEHSPIPSPYEQAKSIVDQEHDKIEAGSTEILASYRQAALDVLPQLTPGEMLSINDASMHNLGELITRQERKTPGIHAKILMRWQQLQLENSIQ